MIFTLEKRDLAGFAIVALLVCALAATAYGLFSNAVERQIRMDAETTSIEWAEYFSKSLNDLENIAAGEPPSADSLRLMEKLRNIGGVFLFKIFDSEGYLKFVSKGPHDPARHVPQLKAHNPQATRVLSAGKPFTAVKPGTPPNRPNLYTETYLPIVENGKTIAVAEVYVDQTNKFATFRKTFLTSVAPLLLLVALAFGAPAAAFCIRTRQKETADQELREQNRKLNVVLEHMAQGFCMFDSKLRLVLANDRYSSIYGLSPDDVRPGVHIEELLRERIDNDTFAHDNTEGYIAERLRRVKQAKRDQAFYKLADGRTIMVSHEPLPDGGWLAIHDDITPLRRIEERAEKLTHFDTVTGLRNRLAFNEVLEKAIAEDPGKSFAVMCIDINNFKGVNDTLGHGVGDAFLCAVAERLVAMADEDDRVARLGDDEFAILRASPDQPQDAEALAGRICDEMQKTFMVEGNEINSAVRIGVAVHPHDGAWADVLIRNADIALTRARAGGAGTFRFFECGMDQHVQSRRQTELGLLHALDEGQFELYYQPIIDTASGRITGCEALLRWNHPERGLVPPDEFISVAEACGLITPIGEWVIRQALSDARAWPDYMKISVNLSTIQLASDRLVPTVMEALSDSGIEAGRLELEITESVFMDEEEAALDRLLALRALGVGIVMDDFGTGYSSLGYLRSFPIDKIKLDRCFTRDLGVKGDAASIVQAVAGLGISLGMDTTAEGVETQEQLQIIRAAGYKEAQGYLFSPPVPADAICERYFGNDEDRDLFVTA